MNTVLTKEKQQEIKYLLQGEDANICPLLPQKNITLLFSLSIYKEYIKDLLISLFSLMDLSQYELYPLYEFFRYKNILLNIKTRELHIFSIYSPSCYSLSLLPLKSVKKYIYMGNAPLNYKHKHGVYKNTNIVVSNSNQFEEIKKLETMQLIVIQNVNIIQGKNINYLYLKNASKAVKHKIGYFSEGWWLRRSGDGFSIEDPELLSKHLDLPKNEKAKLEYLLFQKIIELARKEGITVALYLHPCEERAMSRGFKNPYTYYIDKNLCKYGEKIKGISNFYESKIAITMLPSSSIITDRSSEGMVSIYCSESMLRKFNIHDEYEKLCVNEYEIEINGFEELKKYIAT